MSLAVLADLCALGALPAFALHDESNLSALVDALGSGGRFGSGGGANHGAPLPEAQRAQALLLLAQASLDGAGRTALASVGAPAVFASALVASAPAAHSAARGADSHDALLATRHATQALAQFAAAAEFRTRLAAWGALAPLCAQLQLAQQPDGRARAAALSAVANVSFTKKAFSLSLPKCRTPTFAICPQFISR